MSRHVCIVEGNPLSRNDERLIKKVISGYTHDGERYVFCINPGIAGWAKWDQPFTGEQYKTHVAEVAYPFVRDNAEAEIRNRLNDEQELDDEKIERIWERYRVCPMRLTGPDLAQAFVTAINTLTWSRTPLTHVHVIKDSLVANRIGDLAVPGLIVEEHNPHKGVEYNHNELLRSYYLGTNDWEAMVAEGAIPMMRALLGSRPGAELVNDYLLHQQREEENHVLRADVPVPDLGILGAGQLAGVAAEGGQVGDGRPVPPGVRLDLLADRADVHVHERRDEVAPEEVPPLAVGRMDFQELMQQWD